MRRTLILATALAASLVSATAAAQTPSQLAAAPAGGAPEPERLLTFGPASIAVEAVNDEVRVRATEGGLKIEVRFARAAVATWVAKADIMLVMVGKTDPSPPLRGELGSVKLKPLTAWGEPRYELTVSTRDGKKEVTAELDFSQANDLLGTLRAVSPAIETPRPVGAVDRPVVPKSSNRAPVYPAALRDLGIGGEVMLRIVVDTNGRVEKESIEVVRASDERLARAVRDAVTTWRFAPATAAGARVRQVVELPFVFAPPSS